VDHIDFSFWIAYAFSRIARIGSDIVREQFALSPSFREGDYLSKLTESLSPRPAKTEALPIRPAKTDGRPAKNKTSENRWKRTSAKLADCLP
jgi:hypothetical protein